jgi:hypothetical protein
MYRNMVLPTMTIVMLVTFYLVGVSIGHDSFGFLTTAIALTCFTLLNTFKSLLSKPRFSSVMATQNTSGDK